MTSGALVGGVVVGYGHTRLSDAVADLLPHLHDAVVVLNPQGSEGSVQPDVVRVDRMPHNAGYAAAVNRGVELLSPECDLVLVLTRDAELDRAGLAHLVARLRSDPDVAVVGPLTRVGDELRCGGTYPHPGRAVHRVLGSSGAPVGRVDVDWIDGSVMLIRREVFERLGGFDAGTFMYVDELAFCLAAADAGHAVAVEPLAVASQEPGASRRPRAHGYLVTRNHVRLARRRQGRTGQARAIAAGLAYALRAVVRSAAGVAPGRRHHALSAIGALEGVVAGARGGSGPPPQRVVRGSDVTLTAARHGERPTLLLLYWGRRGGGARMTAELAGAFVATDTVALRVSIASGCEVRDRIDGLGVPVLHASTPSGSALRMVAGLPALAVSWWALARRIRAWRPDLVLVVMGSPWTDPVGWLIRRAAHRSGGNVARIVHDADKHPGDRATTPVWMERVAMRTSDRFVVLSEHVRRSLSDQGIDPALVVVSEHGPFGSGRVRPEIGVLHEPPQILFLGRLAAYKGIPLLVAAAAELAAEGPAPSVRIVGEGDVELPDAPAHVLVERRWIPEAEIPDLLDWADVVVLPYVEASQSGVAPMAIAHGVPVVVTPVGGLAQQVVDGVTGVVADAADSVAVAAAIRSVVADPDRYRRLALACAAASDVDAAWRTIASRMLDDLLGRPGAPAADQRPSS